MKKVLKNFYCIQSKKAYVIGDNYEGDRKDLKGIVEYKSEVKSKKKKDVQSKKSI